MFCTTNIVNNSGKSKWVYCGYGAAFDGKDEGNIGNNSAWNVLIFGVDNSSSSHTANRKNDLLMLSEGDTVGINWRFW